MKHAHTVCAYDALLRFQLAQAQSHGMNEIKISVARAKELLRDISILKKSIDGSRPAPAYFSRLDSIFEGAV